MAIPENIPCTQLQDVNEVSVWLEVQDEFGNTIEVIEESKITTNHRALFHEKIVLNISCRKLISNGHRVVMKFSGPAGRTYTVQKALLNLKMVKQFD